MNIAFATAALLAASVQPQASEAQWVDLIELSDGGMTWYDSASIVRRDGIVRVSMRARPGRSSKTGARMYSSLEELDCSRRTATTITLVADMRDGEIIDIPMDGEVDPINPNTPLDALHANVCAAGNTSERDL